jgi:NhaP-type Na+/H+ or K+/H+ antiporter
MIQSEFIELLIILGLLFVFMAISSSVLQRLPLSTSLVYLLVGFGLGSSGLGLLEFDLVEDAVTLERITEIAVIISLFTAGLKLRVPLSDPLWHIPLRLAFVSMAITVGLVALAGWVGLGLSLGASLILGAVVAPTDPVLASDVQVEHARDTDRLRFSLTGEAGLNDGTAFPFVMLGLGLLELHDLGRFGWRWVAIDLFWAVAAGLAVGALLGTAAGRLVLYLRRTHQEATGLDDFLALGLIALSYAVGLTVEAYGFLAVFAAGLALGRIERLDPESTPDVIEAVDADEVELATRDETASAYLMHALLGFQERLERLAEVAIVVLVGSLLSASTFTGDIWWFVPWLLLVVRPIAVALGLIGLDLLPEQRALISWFGIRGIGSVYYLCFAITHELEEGAAATIADITLATVAVSVVVHGISVTPIMNRYRERYA